MIIKLIHRDLTGNNDENIDSREINITGLSFDDLRKKCINKDFFVVSKDEELNIIDYCYVVFDDNNILYKLEECSSDPDIIPASFIIETSEVIYDFSMYDSWFHNNMLIVKDSGIDIKPSKYMELLNLIFGTYDNPFYDLFWSNVYYHNFLLFKQRKNNKYYMGLIIFPEESKEIIVWEGKKAINEGHEKEFLDCEKINNGIKSYIYNNKLNKEYSLTEGIMDNEIKKYNKIWKANDIEDEKALADFILSKNKS